MVNVIIENLVEIVSSLILMLIGVLGTYLTAKIGKRIELSNINLALAELFDAVNITVSELQQTVVDHLKDASDDGKLTSEEIYDLNVALLAGAKKKLSPSATKLLEAAGMDISELIRSMGEQAVRNIKN